MNNPRKWTLCRIPGNDWVIFKDDEDHQDRETVTVVEQTKPRMKIRNWWFVGYRLFGEIDWHPKLGNCSDGVIKTSRIVSVETLNSIYELEGPIRSAKRQETKQLIRDTDDNPEMG